MSASIRLSDELLQQARKAAKLFHRSPPQQIERWAQIGRVMESVLTYPAQESVANWGAEDDIDALLEEVNSPEGKARARAVILATSDGLFSADPDKPGRIIREDNRSAVR